MQKLNWSTNVFLKITFYDLRVTTKSLNKSMQIFEREHKYASKYVKFIYSEKATEFCEIFTLLLTGSTVYIEQK